MVTATWTFETLLHDFGFQPVMLYSYSSPLLMDSHVIFSFPPVVLPLLLRYPSQFPLKHVRTAQCRAIMQRSSMTSTGALASNAHSPPCVDLHLLFSNVFFTNVVSSISPRRKALALKITEKVHSRYRRAEVSRPHLESNSTFGIKPRSRACTCSWLHIPSISPSRSLPLSAHHSHMRVSK